MAGNSRPSNDPLSLISSTGPLMSARRSVSPPTSISGGPGSIPTILESSASGPNKTSSAPHSPSPVGSLISKENHQSGGATGVPSPTYSQVCFAHVFANCDITVDKNMIFNDIGNFVFTRISKGFVVKPSGFGQLFVYKLSIRIILE